MSQEFVIRRDRGLKVKGTGQEEGITYELKACRIQVVCHSRSEERLWVSCKRKIRARKVGEGPVIKAILFLFEKTKCTSKAMRNYLGF